MNIEQMVLRDKIFADEYKLHAEFYHKHITEEAFNKGLEECRQRRRDLNAGLEEVA